MNEQTPRRVAVTELRRGTPLLAVSGDLDAETCRPVASEVDAVLDARPTAVVLDLRAVGFLGSAGIALLVNAHHRAGRLGVPFAVVADTRCVLRPLRMSQVDAALPLYATVDEAAAALRLVSA
ncbi:STAS domain-containing protein [Saccharothrix longispora]|uniref:STAS domain-containing protein n=1 Tax=Saccharothrix longispora TaxID=33920 RepID=UPI0028FD9641|nr:STAS domain-containing protein [Saccharothrix longispora]MBY8851635.1 STAS domain-containing protein [Saccharothrix sp. MB29]MDU0294420.1 STAS domain-containing protein [Saccharothrix longispora]